MMWMLNGYVKTLIPIGLASKVCSISPYVNAKIIIDTAEVIFIGLNGNLLSLDFGMTMSRLELYDITTAFLLYMRSRLELLYTIWRGIVNSCIVFVGV